MAQPPLRFRCYRCNKMLGVSPSKAGRVVTCPSCQAELIVPEPASETSPNLSSAPASVSSELELGINVGSGPVLNEDPPTAIMSEPTPSRPIFQVEPLTTVEGADLPATQADFDDLGIAIPDPGPSLVETRREPILEREGRGRSRDVVLPRGVVAAWSLLVLLAVVAAFGAGLLTGHYVWKGPGLGSTTTPDKR